MRDFWNWGCCDQIILWRIPIHLRQIAIEARGVDGESYGVGEEGSLFGLLQALTSMWSFFGCNFFEGDTSSLWYEFEVRDANRIALDVCLPMRLNWAKGVMA
jgi:hypothetical protein